MHDVQRSCFWFQVSIIFIDMSATGVSEPNEPEDEEQEALEQEPEQEPWTCEDFTWRTDFSTSWTDVGSDESFYSWIFLYGWWQRVNTMHMEVICETLDLHESMEYMEY